MIRGTITYHDDPSPLFPKGVRLHGTVDPFFLEGVIPPALIRRDPSPAMKRTYRRTRGPPVARFEGELPVPGHNDPHAHVAGRFQVDVFDLGEPPPGIDGDYFDILLTGGSYAGYNRFGYVKGGNIQVEDG